MADRQEFQRFLYVNVARAVGWMVLVAIGIVLWNKYVPDDYVETIMKYVSNPWLVYGIYFASETLFGILPPEIFIGWAFKWEGMAYVPNVALLAVMSYIAGIIAYGAGSWLRHFNFVQRLLSSAKSQQYVGYYHKWGGIVIILSALTPVPFATVSLLSGSLGFGFNKYLLYSSTRVLRFVIWAIVIHQANGL